MSPDAKPSSRRHAPAPALARFGILLLGCALLTGCGMLGKKEAVYAYDPANTWATAPVLPWDIKRVAVLPLMADDRTINMIEGRKSLEPVLQAELVKSKRFEVVRIPPEELRSRTGRAGWTGEEALPPKFLASLRNGYACDAVLFSQLTVFRAYPPLAVGWRLRLVDARSGDTIWAGDEIFDSGKPEVLAGARQYQSEQDKAPRGSDAWVILSSPRRFGQYAAARLVATMPDR